MSNTSSQSNATCPACGLLCDDVIVTTQGNQVKVIKNGCPKSVAFFEQTSDALNPSIDGVAVHLNEAISHVASILKRAESPLITGLSTDITGFRALFGLSQKINANLKHMNANSISRNIKVLQSTGWQTTTLTEVKNRADVIVCFGSNIEAHNPRFYERFVDVDGMFVTTKNRQVIVLGNTQKTPHIKSDTLQPQKLSPLNISAEADYSCVRAAQILACRADDLPSVTIALRALVAGKTLKANEVAGISMADLQTVAEKLKVAKYAVLIWVAKDFNFPHAELTIQNITETVAILNQTTRAAGLALGGSDGDTSANYAHTWLSGLTLNDDAIAHDCLVWVNSFSRDKSPPETNKPLIVLGTQAPLGITPNVFIPVATPALDCAGSLFRVDGSVTLPLKKIRESKLPTLGEVVRKIEALL